MFRSYDLRPSSERCDTFRVAFDVYSPRAHFIILPQDRSRVSKDYNNLDHTARLKIIKAAMAMVSHYKLQNSAILSLHCGTWGSAKDKFHVHVCVDVEDYLRIFEAKQSEIPNWPSRNYVTKEWKKSQNPNHYVMNVRAYPFKTYFRDEVRVIEDYRRQCLPSTSTAVAPAIPPNFTILYHPSEPKVGFAVDDSLSLSSAEFLLEAQEALFEFARRNNLTDKNSKDENSGCHVCLVLDGKTHGKLNSCTILRDCEI